MSEKWLMSEVLLIMVKDNSITLHFNHYRDIIERMNSKILEVGKDVDAGYILVDFDNGAIVNAQNAFGKNDVSNLLLKGFSWINV